MQTAFQQAVRGTHDAAPVLVGAVRQGLQQRASKSVQTTDKPVPYVPEQAEDTSEHVTTRCSDLAIHYLKVMLFNENLYSRLALPHFIKILVVQRQHIPVSLAPVLLSFYTDWDTSYLPYIYLLVGRRGHAYLAYASNHPMREQLAHLTWQKAQHITQQQIRQVTDLKRAFSNPAVNLTPYDYGQLMSMKIPSPALCIAFLHSVERGQWDRYFPRIGQSSRYRPSRYYIALADSTQTPSPRHETGFRFHRRMYNDVAVMEKAK